MTILGRLFDDSRTTSRRHSELDNGAEKGMWKIWIGVTAVIAKKTDRTMYKKRKIQLYGVLVGQRPKG